MYQALAMLVAMLAIGIGLRRFGLVSQELPRDLNQIVFFVTLPALVFSALHRSPLDPGMAVLPIAGWLTAGLGLLFGWILARSFALPPARTGSVLLLCGFANITFMGYPVIEGFYGAHHLTLAILYDLFGTTPGANLLGVWIGSAWGASRGSGRDALLKLAKFPPIWALVGAFASRAIAIPHGAMDLIGRIGGLTTPLVMLSIGLSLQLHRLRESWPLVGAISFVRLIAVPLVVYGVGRAIALPTDVLRVTVLEGAMPCMFLALILATQFELDDALIIDCLLVTIALSLVTLPIWRVILP
jgi:hypothetical protein